MILLNFFRRMGAASDNALFCLPKISRKKNFQVIDSKTSIMLNRHCADAENLLNTTPISSNQSPFADCYVKSPSRDTLPGQIGQPSPALSIVRGEVSESFVARVLNRLNEAEWKAPLGVRDDIRVAWITVLKADEGHPTPFAQAFFQYFSVSPEKLIPFLSARADINRIWAQSQAAWMEKYLPFRHHDGWRETFARIQAELEAHALPPKKPAASAPAPKITRRVA